MPVSGKRSSCIEKTHMSDPPSFADSSDMMSNVVAPDPSLSWWCTSRLPPSLTKQLLLALVGPSP